MDIAVFGAGYVGLVTGACLAKHGHRVCCVDVDQKKIEALRRGSIPIYEPGLGELIESQTKAGRLSFTTDGEGAVASSEVIFIAVGTPPLPSGEADLAYVREVALTIAKSMRGYRVIVTKSTVPVGTTDLIATIIGERNIHAFDVVSNPEFLREGAAVKDCLNPDRIVLGVRTDRARAIMTRLYESFGAPIVVTDPRSAEMIKYASNAFLAVKISYINEIAALCEHVGADVVEVARGMGLDPRIGPSFLRAGIGYGGSCFPKDTEAIIHTAREVGIDLPIVQSAVRVNAEQRERVVRRLESILGSLAGKRIGILGLAFKPETDDVREAPALDVIQRLVRSGAAVRAFDPKANANAAMVLERECKEHMKSITICDAAEDVADGADAMLLITEWPEFAAIDWRGARARMRRPVVYDTRNFLDPSRIQELGYSYHCVGRGTLDPVPVTPAASIPVSKTI